MPTGLLYLIRHPTNGPNPKKYRIFVSKGAHLDRSFADGGYRVPEPLAVAGEELALVELEAELAREQRQLRDDGVPHAPVRVGAELVDRGHHAGAQPLVAEDVLRVVEALDDVEPHLRHLHTYPVVSA